MSSEPVRAGRVALLGRPNVGKSTLLNALLGEPIAITSPHPQTTREAVRGVLTVGPTQYVFVDTPGLHAAKSKLGDRMNRTARDEASEADAVVLVAEVRPGRAGGKSGPGAGTGTFTGEKPAFSSADYEADLALARELGRLPAVLVLNKIDRLPAKTQLFPILEAFGAAHAFAAIVPMSARRGDGAPGLLKGVERHAVAFVRADERRNPR